MDDLTGLTKQRKADAHRDLVNAIIDVRKIERKNRYTVGDWEAARENLRKAYNAAKDLLEVTIKDHATVLKDAEDYLGIADELRIVKVEPDEKETSP